MTPEVLQKIFENSISIGVLIFFAIYFMKQIEKKDNLHAETTKEFINLTKESNQVHIETRNAINESNRAMSANTAKLESLHNDIYQGKFCKAKS